MKKTVCGLFICLSLILSLISCNLTFADEELLPEPDVACSTSSITVSIPVYDKDADYVSLYREDDKSNTITLAILYPDQMDSSSSYIYNDTMIIKNKKYSYRARYYVDGEYYYSEWSSEITATAGYETGTSFSYGPSKIVFEYESSDKSILLRTSLEEPSIDNFEEDYKLMLIASAGSRTQVFELPEDLSKSISLTGLLPEYYLSREVTIEGIVGQKLEYKDPAKPKKSEIKIVSWTEPTEVEISGATEKKKLSFHFSNAMDGADYSRKAN